MHPLSAFPSVLIPAEIDKWSIKADVSISTKHQGPEEMQQWTNELTTNDEAF